MLRAAILPSDDPKGGRREGEWRVCESQRQVRWHGVGVEGGNWVTGCDPEEYTLR